VIVKLRENVGDGSTAEIGGNLHLFQSAPSRTPAQEIQRSHERYRVSHRWILTAVYEHSLTTRFRVATVGYSSTITDLFLLIKWVPAHVLYALFPDFTSLAWWFGIVVAPFVA